MSSERQTEYGRSSYRLVREQRMLAKREAENGNSKDERAKSKTSSNNSSTCLLKQATRLLVYETINSSTRQLVYYK